MYSLVYITAKDTDQARCIGKALVAERLVACVNIIPSIESIYWWEGKPVEDTEAVLVAKTRAELVDAVISRIKQLHSYKVPCIVALPITNGNPDFLSWIGTETRCG